MAPALHKAIASPKGFAKSIDKFIQACKDKEELATIVGLALALECNKDSLNRWADKYSQVTEHDPHLLIYGALKKVKDFGEWQLTQKCYTKNAAMSLALGKCMFGWVEQQHVKHEHSGGISVSVASNIPGPLATTTKDT